jgi:hypothetical protein
MKKALLAAALIAISTTAYAQSKSYGKEGDMLLAQSEETVQDMACLADLSYVRDLLIDSGSTYENNNALKVATQVQDKIFLKYEIGHPYINTIRLDKVKGNRLKIFGGEWVKNKAIQCMTERY